MRDHAERVGKVPAREGIGRETLVHQRQCRNTARILQVEEVLAHLVGQQQALVDDGACRQRSNVELLAVGQAQRLDGVCRGAADDVELALERIGNEYVGTAPDENLADDRLVFLDRRRHRHRARHRHVAPAEENLAFGTNGTLDFFLTGNAAGAFLRQEAHADTVFASRRQGHALLGHFFAEEGVRQLYENAGTVAHQRICAYGTPVIQVFQDQQALFDDGVSLLAFDMGNEPHAAGVVFVSGVVQTLLLRYCLLYYRIHHA